MDKKVLENTIIEVLKTVYDPEIPVDIYELGLIYDIKVNDDYHANVLMTLTSPSCPVAESLPEEVEQKIAGINGLTGASVKITFEPPWEKGMMSEEAQLELGFM